MDLKSLVFIFPIVFMIHELEEIIFFKKWIENEKDLLRRFPTIAKKIVPHFKNISTSSFTVGVAEEFILASIISILAVLSNNYKIWYGIYIGFSLHLIIHIIQWIIYRKYIPNIVTSFLILPYCIYGFIKINEWQLISPLEQITWGLIGFTIIILNLILVHKLISKFEIAVHSKNIG